MELIVIAILVHPLVDRVVRWAWPSQNERATTRMLELQEQAVRTLGQPMPMVHLDDDTTRETDAN